MITFKPNGTSVLLGSLPHENHKEATEFMLHHTPDIPGWIQLPKFPAEGMLNQFMAGLPGGATRETTLYVDAAADSFHTDMAAFYEEYLTVTEAPEALAGSRFALPEKDAPGFNVLQQVLTEQGAKPAAVKGQITGPVTQGIGLKDQDDKYVFYDDTLRDIIVKMIGLRARWQAVALGKNGAQSIVFFDEPGIVSFGSSAFIGLSRDHIQAALTEVIQEVHNGGGLAGIHVCSNCDWSLIFDAKTDIISFDAYSYFDRFILYPDALKAFLSQGGILAWGIVPTSGAESIEKESADSLFTTWQEQVAQVEALGFSRQQIVSQTIISPSCGTGSMSMEHAAKVLEMTRDLSAKVQALV